MESDKSTFDSISKFRYLGDREGFEWSCGDVYHQRRFGWKVVAVPLKSGKGILVAEPASPHAPHNATILDADGNIRSRVMNPKVAYGAICFCDAFYEGENLRLTIALSSMEMNCYIDEEGRVLKVTEAR